MSSKQMNFWKFQGGGRWMVGGYDFGLFWNFNRASRFFRVLPKLGGMAVYGTLEVRLKPPAKLC